MIERKLKYYYALKLLFYLCQICEVPISMLFWNSLILKLQEFGLHMFASRNIIIGEYLEQLILYVEYWR